MISHIYQTWHEGNCREKTCDIAVGPHRGWRHDGAVIRGLIRDQRSKRVGNATCNRQTLAR